MPLIPGFFGPTPLPPQHCLRNWGIAYLGNCLGTLTMVYLADVAHLTTAQPWAASSAAIATAKASAPKAAKTLEHRTRRNLLITQSLGA